jgi:hypothetical protein
MSTTERTTLTLRNYYPRTIRLDPDSDPVAIRIRRFSPDQLLEFQQGWGLIENPESERAIYRKDGEDDVPMAEVRRRRLMEMSPDVRAEFDALEQREVARNLTFACEQIRQHVSIDPSVRLVVEDDSGDPRVVKSGADIAEVFAGNLSVLLELVGAVAAENVLSAEKKRAWRARSALSSSSTPQVPTSGGAPAVIVESAAPIAPNQETDHFASSADVSVPSDSTPSFATV